MKKSTFLKCLEGTKAIGHLLIAYLALLNINSIDFSLIFEDGKKLKYHIKITDILRQIQKYDINFFDKVIRYSFDLSPAIQLLESHDKEQLVKLFFSMAIQIPIVRAFELIKSYSKETGQFTNLKIRIDTMLLDLGYVEIGKYLNLPTHAYLGMSDTKILDMQSGVESGMGALLAGIKGVNMISGAGMIDFETTQSIQKVVIDNQMCGMIHRFNRGIEQRDEPIAKNLLIDLEEKTHLLSHDHTLKWFKKEHFIPNQLIDRSTNEEWINKGRKTIDQRAKEEVDNLLVKYSGTSLDKDKISDLIEIMSYKDVDFRKLLEM